MKYFVRTTMFWCLLSFTLSYSSAQDSIKPSFFDHLSEIDSVSLYVVTKTRDLLKKKDEYLPADFTFRSGKSILYEFKGEIRTRGNIRKIVCYYPPTKLRFPVEFLKENGFSDYKTLKLVNSCSNSSANETYVETEYLIYKMYNLFTEKSFRVKKIYITYESTDKNKKIWDFPAFFIEHEDQVADRVEGTVYNLKYFKEEMLERNNFLTMCMFQYMIGNTDWKILNRHNVRILRIPKEKGIFSVAYDFDYAGLVNTSYAVPHETLPITNVRERLYQGPCFTENELRAVRQLFVNKKADLMSLVESSNLSDNKKKDCRNYLDNFYKELEHEKLSQRIFVNCK
jgi:hypothetical protein